MTISTKEKEKFIAYLEREKFELLPKRKDFECFRTKKENAIGVFYQFDSTDTIEALDPYSTKVMSSFVSGVNFPVYA